MKDIKCYRVVHIVNNYSKYWTLGWSHRTLTDCGATKRCICCLDSCHSLKNCLSTLKLTDKEVSSLAIIFTCILLHIILLSLYTLSIILYVFQHSHLSTLAPMLTQIGNAIYLGGGGIHLDRYLQPETI